jgi:D-mannonate dehydratase
MNKNLLVAGIVGMLCASVAAYEVRELTDEEWEIRQMQMEQERKTKRLEQRTDALERQQREENIKYYQEEQKKSIDAASESFGKAAAIGAELITNANSSSERAFYIVILILGLVFAIAIPLSM